MSIQESLTLLWIRETLMLSMPQLTKEEDTHIPMWEVDQVQEYIKLSMAVRIGIN